ncbi:MAG: hypothetical protein Ct9H300mP25_06580 [Acidobacteriota bacterium]|nr:MAG: hypothetical protein Ct9H300mP25_06580 [Acidobacteriota bacterium]
MWTGNAAHGIPLERPSDLGDVENLTAEEAAARREGAHSAVFGATSVSGEIQRWAMTKMPRLPKLP